MNKQYKKYSIMISEGYDIFKSKIFIVSAMNLTEAKNIGMEIAISKSCFSKPVLRGAWPEGYAY